LDDLLLDASDLGVQDESIDVGKSALYNKGVTDLTNKLSQHKIKAVRELQGANCNTKPYSSHFIADFEYRVGKFEARLASAVSFVSSPPPVARNSTVWKALNICVDVTNAFIDEVIVHHLGRVFVGSCLVAESTGTGPGTSVESMVLDAQRHFIVSGVWPIVQRIVPSIIKAILSVAATPTLVQFRSVSTSLVDLAEDLPRRIAMGAKDQVFSQTSVYIQQASRFGPGKGHKHHAKWSTLCVRCGGATATVLCNAISVLELAVRLNSDVAVKDAFEYDYRQMDGSGGGGNWTYGPPTMIVGHVLRQSRVFRSAEGDAIAPMVMPRFPGFHELPVDVRDRYDMSEHTTMVRTGEAGAGGAAVQGEAEGRSAIAGLCATWGVDKAGEWTSRVLGTEGRCPRLAELVTEKFRENMVDGDTLLSMGETAEKDIVEIVFEAPAILTATPALLSGSSGIEWVAMRRLALLVKAASRVRSAGGDAASTAVLIARTSPFPAILVSKWVSLSSGRVAGSGTSALAAAIVDMNIDGDVLVSMSVDEIFALDVASRNSINCRGDSVVRGSSAVDGRLGDTGRQGGDRTSRHCVERLRALANLLRKDPAGAPTLRRHLNRHDNAPGAGNVDIHTTGGTGRGIEGGGSSSSSGTQGRASPQC
jgi:hypothetical protein